MTQAVKRRKFLTITFGHILAAAVLMPAATATAQESDTNFLKDKNVTIVVGYSPGGGYDRYARTLANHMHRHLPGASSVIVQNMPGASSIRAANYIASKAPRDGTVMGVFSSSAAFSPLLGNKAALFKPDEFTWIGNMDQQTGTCSVWHTSGIKTFKDLLTRDVIFGASGPAGFDSEIPRAINKLLGTRIRVIHGYNGSSSVFLAVKRGEVMGSCGFTLGQLKSVRRQDFMAGHLVPVMQYSLRSPDLKNVPHIVDLAGNEENRKVFQLVFTRDILGRPVAAPPGLDLKRAKVLRASFTATMKDEAMIRDAERTHLTLNPWTGAQAEDYVREMSALSSEAIARAREALAVGKIEKAQLKSLEGTIAKVDAKRIEMKDSSGKMVQLRLHAKQSAIVIANKKSAPKALKVGMACTVRYLGAGDLAKTVACN
jgi:tripartite-type tricarboxylate transporter receptor subunit TctC